MYDHLQNKKIVMEYNKSICNSTVDSIASVMDKYYHENVEWNGPQPLNTINGRRDLVDKFYKPLLHSFPDLQKYVYMHFAGTDPLFGNDNWVVSSGNYIGTFKNEFLGIAPSEGCVWIRYMEYNKIIDGKIALTYVLIDIMDLIRQSGIKFIESMGSEINIPAPASFDGVNMGESDIKETEKTFDIVHSMCWKGLSSFKDKGFGDMGLEGYWHDGFMWYGPCGIGSTKGLKGFQKDHQIPFLNGLPDRVYPKRTTDEKNAPFFAEGFYAGYIWWSGFDATHSGNDWLGMPATNKKLNIRCADLYRREGDKLAENWVLLDIIDILLQMGVDVFDRIRRNVYTIKC